MDLVYGWNSKQNLVIYLMEVINIEMIPIIVADVIKAVEFCFIYQDGTKMFCKRSLSTV